MTTKEKKLCIYCLKNIGDTADHVPPKSFFVKPRPVNLITVPCCEECRKEQPSDDEYFKTAIVSSRDVSEQDATQPLVESVKRALVRPRSRGFAQLVSDSMVELDVHSGSGIFLGTAGAFNLDKSRMDRVAQRILRGLYFHEFGKALPLHYDVSNVCSQQGFTHCSEILDKIAFPTPVEIGNTFWYTYAAVPEDPYTSVWLQVFYNALPFVGFTKNPAHKKE